MAITDARLNLITFPQRWNGARISLRVLALPKGDPRAPLFPGAAAFANARLRLRARMIGSLDEMPNPADALAAGEPFAQTPENVAAVFDTLAERFNINPALVGNPRPANTRIKKYISRSYQKAFHFEGPSREFIYTGDAYECVLKGPTVRPRFWRPETR